MLENLISIDTVYRNKSYTPNAYESHSKRANSPTSSFRETLGEQLKSSTQEKAKPSSSREEQMAVYNVCMNHNLRRTLSGKIKTAASDSASAIGAYSLA